MNTRLLGFLALLGCKDPASDKASDPMGNLAPVEIVIDDLGVAHLYAESDHDLFHAAGYQMAADRLYQAEMLRRFAHGRMAEVLGEEALARDQQSRIFDLARLGAEDQAWMQAHDPERARLLSAWISGINRRIEEIRDGSAPVPYGFGPDHHDFEPEPWTDTDAYVVLKGANVAIDMTLEFEIALTLVGSLYSDALESIDLFRPAHDVFGLPESDRPAAAAGPPPDPAKPARLNGLNSLSSTVTRALSSLPRAQGSNNWAVDGRHTRSGRSLLAGDPHMGFDFFGSPLPMHLNSKDGGGSYDVAGFAFPGTPGIALGHTDSVAWTATSSFADVMDTWIVTRVGDGVRIGEDVLMVEEREEAFIVRGLTNPAGEGETVTLVYEDIPGVGVVLPRSLLPLPVGDFVVAWTGMNARRASWFLELNQVDSIASFERAVDRMGEMNYNLVAASADEIAYRVGVQVPDRGTVGGALTPWEAMDGDDPDTWWTGEFLSSDKLPGSRAPERGWIATANNDPFGFSDNGKFSDDPWYYGSLYAPGYRAHRIHAELDRLTGTGQLTAQDMVTLQLDTHSTLADDLLPLLEAAHARIGTDPDLADFASNQDLDALVALLTEDWDRRMVRESTAAPAFHEFLHQLAAEVLADDITLAYDMAIELKSVFIIKVAALTVQGEFPGEIVLQDGADRTLLAAADAAAASMVARFGQVDGVRYEDIKTTRFDHALGYGIALGDRATDGGEDTINVSQDMKQENDGQGWYSSHVSVERVVVDFNADGTPSAQVNFPFASHADPQSAQSQAAMTDYVEGGYRALPFRRKDVDAHTAESSVLEPR